MGRYSDISEEFKQGWAFTWCVCAERKRTTFCLLFYMPARLANTWDAVGLVPYWEGVRQAVCCCAGYMFGCCLCAAIIPGRHRSNIRDFFGFGDKVKGNIELSDYCCYLCCP